MGYTLSFPVQNVTLYSSYTKNGSNVVRPATEGSGERTVTVTGIPTGATVESATLIVYMTGYNAYGTNKKYTKANGYECSSNGQSINENRVPVTVEGNGDVTIPFIYKANEIGTPTGEKTYNYSVTFSSMVLEVVYSDPIPTTPPQVTTGWYTLAADNTGSPASGLSAYVAGYSKIRATFDPSKVIPAQGLTIASFSATYNGITATEEYESGTVYITTGVIQGTSSGIVLTVTDSAGNSTSESATVEAYAYARPALTNLNVYRSNGQKQPDDNGTRITARASHTFSSLGGHNTCTVTAKYKTYGGTYSSPAVLPNDTPTIITPTDISTQSNYIVRIEAVDALGNSAAYEQTIYGQRVPFHIKRGGRAAAFGKYAENDDSLETNWILRLYNGMTFGVNDAYIRISQDLTALQNVPTGVSDGCYIEIGTRYILISDNGARLYIGFKTSGVITWYAITTTQV